MANVEHNTLTGSELHETKGAAAATVGQVLTATGSATAVYQDPVQPSRYLRVAQGGGDYTSIGAAITAAIALSPTETDQIVIAVYAGAYVESALTLPAYVSLGSVDGPNTVRVSTATNTDTVLTLNDGAYVHSITVQGASGTGGIGVKLAAGATVEIRHVVIHDCETAISADGVGTHLHLESVHIDRSVGEVLTTGISMTGGATASCSDLSIRGKTGALITTGLLCTGSAGYIDVLGFIAEYCTAAVSAASSGSCDITSGHIQDCTVAVYSGAGGQVTTAGLIIENSTTWDYQADTATSFLRIASGIATHEKLSIHASADIAGIHVSDTPNESAVKIVSELHVGSEIHPREIAVGGGDSHVRNMKVFTNTNLEAGTWADITSTVNVDDGSSIALFAGTGVANCVYVGGSSPFPGTKIDVTAAMSLGSGALIEEYWNGSAWTEVKALSTDADFPYTQYGNSHLLRIQNDHIRFDWPSLSTWATKLLNGSTLYWARYRITSAITTAPAANIVKLHTHRSEINADGFIESFGKGEQTTRKIDMGPGYALVSSAPGDSNVAYGTDLEAAVLINVFSNSQVKGRVYSFTLPVGLDTSRELTLTIPWRPATSGSGNVELEASVVVVNVGDVLDGTATPVVSTPVVVAVASDLDKYFATELKIRLTSAVPPSLIALKFWRDATAGNADDTYAANIEIVTEPDLTGTFWR